MIVILKYNAGNSTSVKNAVDRLGFDSIITSDPDLIANSEKIIFPGVGQAKSAMKYLKNCGLDRILKTAKQPVLGICLGLQLLCRFTEESDTECLGVFDSIVKKFPKKDRVPHIGWNNINNIKGEIFKDIKKEDDFYFVHSYYAEVNSSTVATCDYILPFSAALQKNNFFATQFHPEKSGKVGELILKNFLSL